MIPQKQMIMPQKNDPAKTKKSAKPNEFQALMIFSELELILSRISSGDLSVM